MNRFFHLKADEEHFWLTVVEHSDSDCVVDVVVTYGVCARWPVSWRWWRLTWSVLKNVQNRENRKLCRSLMTLVWLLVCSCLGCSRIVVLFVLSRGHELLFYAVSLYCCCSSSSILLRLKTYNQKKQRYSILLTSRTVQMFRQMVFTLK